MFTYYKPLVNITAYQIKTVNKVNERKLTNSEISRVKDSITMTGQEVANKYGVSAQAIKQTRNSVIFKTGSLTIKEAIYKLSKAGVIALVACSVLSGSITPARPSTRRNASRRPAISYQVKFISGASA